MTTLYRKYRPQTFADVHDQEHIIKTLTNEISTGKIAHAYLFTGPRGVGKTTTARLLAKALNCKKRKAGEFEPCDECASCTEITHGNNIDVIEIDAASHTGVDNVRENIIENAQFKPTLSPFKIFIIDEVHMLSTSAFNALLKTIEEPQAHVIFILATTELQKLPATIISRCQRFAFKKITRESMLEKLEKICKDEKIKVQKSVLEKIITKSEGGMRDAESLLGQVFSLNLKEITDEDVTAILPTADFGAVLEFLTAIFDSKVSVAIEQINNLADNGANLEQFALSLIDILRAILIGQTGYDLKNIINTDKESLEKIKALSSKIPTSKIVAMIESALLRKRELKQTPVPQLPLELLAVQFGAQNFEPVQEVKQPIVQNVVKTEVKPDLKVEAKPIATVITESIKTVISDLTHKSSGTTTLEEIKAKWNDIVSSVAKATPSLTFILRSTELRSLDSSGLRLIFSYKIHLEKIEEMKNRKLIEDELEKTFGERIRIQCAVESAEIATPSNELTELAAEFGGELM